MRRGEPNILRHGIDETTPPPAAKGTVDIRIALKAMCPALTAQQHVLVLMCRFGLSNRIVDDEQFREVTNTKVSRNKVPELLGDIAETLIDAALPNFATCTLAIDVGTVHQRYLAFVLVNSNGRALFYTMVADTDERVNGHFTIPAVRAVVRDVLAALGRCQVNVCSIVADNASNLQGISNADGDEEAVAEDEVIRRALPLVHRCACHVIQLMVKDLADKWQTAFFIAERLLKEKGVRMSSTETRWNSKWFVIEKAINAGFGNASEVREMQDAARILHPFAVATDYLQRDSATMFDTVGTVEELLHWFIKLREAQNETDFGRATKESIAKVLSVIYKRAWMLFDKAYVVLAFFSPTTDTTNSPNVRKMLPVVKEFLDPFNIPPAEWKKFEMSIFDNVAAPIDQAAYIARINATLGRACPTIALAVTGLATSVPSEAAVERHFSKLKYTFDQWRNRAGPTLVNATLRTSAAWSFFHPRVVDEEDVALPDPTPLKAARTESQPDTPAPRTPVTPLSFATPATQRGDPFEEQARADAARARAATQDVDDESDDESFQLEDVQVEAMFDQILERAANPIAPIQTAASVSAVGARTRSGGEKCKECGRPLRSHEYHGYVTCNSTKCRAWHPRLGTYLTRPAKKSTLSRLTSSLKMRASMISSKR
jgi:hypothetical protein